MPATIIAEQTGAKDLSSIRGSKYKSYYFLVDAGTTYADNEIKIGEDLRDKYGTPYNIPAISGFILTSASVSLKFNSLDNDVIEFDVSLMGHIWTFTRGDLLVDKIFFAKPSSPAAAATVQVFVCGSRQIQMD
jgi:hypothetical protein